jgi:ferredoxin
MKSVVYYFSSTGNSLYAARRIAKGIGAGQPVSIVGAGKGGADPEAETVGIVFPVYLHKTPALVLDFLSRSAFASGAQVFAVATNNGGPGSCMRGVDAALRKRGARLSAGFGILMPGNSVILADLTNGSQERARRLAESEAEMDAIIEAVLSRELNEFGRREKAGSWLRSRFFGLVSEAYRLPRHFRAGEGCTRCGVCVRACPRANIELDEKGPRWGKACEKCLGCYHACPAKAIDIDDYTASRLRYRHPSVRLEELLYSTMSSSPSRLMSPSSQARLK